jgi:hypothetical protein
MLQHPETDKGLHVVYILRPSSTAETIVEIIIGEDHVSGLLRSVPLVSVPMAACWRAGASFTKERTAS